MSDRLEVRGVRKAYGATVAVEHADLVLHRGEVHALLGENGAGKSTLVKMIGGIVTPDEGTITLDGKPYRPGSINDARAVGVATAFQELSLLLNFSIARNLLLPCLPKTRARLISGKASRDRAAAILERHGLGHLDPDVEVGRLTLADRQRIEIVRAMHNASAVLVLDEPTAALSDTEWLFGLVRRLTSGGMAVLYISHRLAEVRALSARATVLRNGRGIGTVSLADASDADIFEMMVGRRESSIDPATSTAGHDERISLSARHLRTGGLRDVSFDLHPGEILGIAALEGQGQQPLLRALAGLERLDGGEIRVDGVLAGRTSPTRMLGTGEGLAYLPEERKSEGILPGLSTASNVVLSIVSSVAALGLVFPRREKVAAREQGNRVDLDDRYLGFDIAALSGGNQQKALIARVLATGARTLVLFDPTRGVDVGTKQSIYRAMEAFARSGGTVVFYTSELPEIVQLAHRCIVLYGGRVQATLERDRLDERTLVAALVGHADGADAAEHPGAR